MLFALETARKTHMISQHDHELLIDEFNTCPSKHELMQKEPNKFNEEYYKSLIAIQVVYFCNFMQAFDIASEAL